MKRKVALALAGVGAASLLGLGLLRRREDQYLLVGDIGGTNIRLRILRTDGRSTLIVKESFMKVADYDFLENALVHFIAGEKRVRAAVLAMAGPIDQNSVLMSNVLKWGKITGEHLARALNLVEVVLLNDFEAVSYGLDQLEPGEVRSLNGLKADPQQLRVVLGPGTGLGTSILVNIEGHLKVLPGQGGHIPPLLQEQVDLEFVRYYEKEKGKTPVLQNVFCGPAIPLLYSFLKEKGGRSGLTDEQERALQAGETQASRLVMQRGCAKEDPLCEQVVQFVWKMYLRVIANYACIMLPKGGIYLTGSLTGSLIPLLEREPELLQDCLVKGREYLRGSLGQIPLLWVEESELGLKGAAWVGLRLMRERGWF